MVVCPGVLDVRDVGVEMQVRLQQRPRRRAPAKQVPEVDLVQRFEVVVQLVGGIRTPKTATKGLGHLDLLEGVNRQLQRLFVHLVHRDLLDGRRGHLGGVGLHGVLLAGRSRGRRPSHGELRAPQHAVLELTPLDGTGTQPAGGEPRELRAETVHGAQNRRGVQFALETLREPAAKACADDVEKHVLLGVAGHGHGCGQQQVVPSDASTLPRGKHSKLAACDERREGGEPRSELVQADLAHGDRGLSTEEPAGKASNQSEQALLPVQVDVGAGHLSRTRGCRGR